jgi:hypothetical protein
MKFLAALFTAAAALNAPVLAGPIEPDVVSHLEQRAPVSLGYTTAPLPLTNLTSDPAPISSSTVALA